MLKFRFARPSDLGRLVQINIGQETSYRKLNERMFREIIPQKRVLCALQDREVVALLYWCKEFLGRTNQWYLEQITVEANYRNQGCGVTLLRYFLKYAKKRKTEKVFADIHNDNIASLKMSLAAGALISGFIEGIGKTKMKDERVIVRFEL